MTITHDRESRRFFAVSADGELMGEISYDPREGAFYADHTHTQSQFRGQGVAGRLLDALADHAREQGVKIVPLCSYVIGAFQRYPDRYGDVEAK